jgi:hypothetical protein
MANGLLIVFHGCGSAWIDIHDVHGHARRCGSAYVVSNYHEVGQINIYFARRSLVAPEPQLVATSMGSVMECHGARPRPMFKLYKWKELCITSMRVFPYRGLIVFRQNVRNKDTENVTIQKIKISAPTPCLVTLLSLRRASGVM